MIALPVGSEHRGRCRATGAGLSVFKRSALCTIVTIVATPGACDRPPPDGLATEAAPTVTARDSAGIEIVENHAPQYAPGEFWTIDPEPEFVLGGANTLGEPAHDSAQLVWDVAGFARLEDGRVAVLSSRGVQLLLFEPSGELSRIIGRAGEGPGEFTRPEWLQYLPPDTLVVWDYFLTSIDYFSPDGTLLRERRVDHAAVRELGLYGEDFSFPLPDGSFIAFMRNREVDPEPPWSDCSPGEGWLVPGTPETGFAGEGSIFTFPASEFVRVDGAESHSFGCPSQMAVGGDPPSIYIPARDMNQIYQFNLDGFLSRIIRRTTDPVPVTPEARRAMEERMESRYRELEAQGWIRPPKQMDYDPPDDHPPVFDVIVDTEGYLWTREWSASETGLPDQWSVFSPQGRWLGSLAVPWPIDLADSSSRCRGYRSSCWVDRDFFMILRRDEFDVERVEGYRIRREAIQGGS